MCMVYNVLKCDGIISGTVPKILSSSLFIIIIWNVYLKYSARQFNTTYIFIFNYIETEAYITVFYVNCNVSEWLSDKNAQNYIKQ